MTTYFIRTVKDNVLVDIDFFKSGSIDDVSTMIDLEEYTAILLSLPEDKMPVFCRDMSMIQEIRGIWFEGFVDKDKEIEIKGFVKTFMLAICDKWGLCFVED